MAQKRKPSKKEKTGSEAFAAEKASQEKKIQPVEEILFRVEGKMSTCGGHNFTPGFCRLGATSCRDKLFGPVHSQATIAAWVAANV
jgi:hypothetical protein